MDLRHGEKKTYKLMLVEKKLPLSDRRCALWYVRCEPDINLYNLQCPIPMPFYIIVTFTS